MCTLTSNVYLVYKTSNLLDPFHLSSSLIQFLTSFINYGALKSWQELRFFNENQWIANNWGIIPRSQNYGCLPVIEDSSRKNGQNTNEFNLNARENFVREDVKQLEKITEESWEVFKIYLKVIASPTYING